MSTPTPAQPGFFGKLPARGDFVGRRLDPDFRNGFDGWLQTSIASSRRQLGAGWMPAYLEAPVWRFVLGGGLCGAAPALGVMMPSVDRVGRYFPLVVAAHLPGCLSPATMFQNARDWFDAAAQAVLRALDDDVDVEDFDRLVLAIGVPAYAGAAAGGGLLTDLAAGGAISPAHTGMLDRLSHETGFSLWWMQGSDRIRPAALLCGGLPAPENFAAFLDGAWDEWGWAQPGDGSTALGGLPVRMAMP